MVSSLRLRLNLSIGPRPIAAKGLSTRQETGFERSFPSRSDSWLPFARAEVLRGPLAPRIHAAGPEPPGGASNKAVPCLLSHHREEAITRTCLHDRFHFGMILLNKHCPAGVTLDRGVFGWIEFTKTNILRAKTASKDKERRNGRSVRRHVQQ